MGSGVGEDLDARHRRTQRQRLHPGRQDRRERGRLLRILLLDSWHRTPAEGSGTAVAISTLAKGLRSAGHEVRVLSTASTRPLLLRRLQYNLGLHERIRAADPDLAVGFDLDGFLLPDRRTYPLVVQLKGIAADEARFERGLSGIILRILSILERRNARRADRVVVPSIYSAEVAARTYGLDPERIAVVPEALDPEPWHRLRASSPPRPGAAPTILSVARQYPRKNTHMLLRALLRITPSLPDVRLRIVGGGPELPRLKAAVRDLGLEGRVDLLGGVADSEDVRREYFRADCFCLPSLQEGFGLVFLEAMAAGLPVVAGRAGAVPEVVPDGEVGILVDPEDPEEIADAILRVLTDRDLSRRLGAAGIERAGRFTPARTADAFLDAVNPLLEEPTSRDELAHRRERDVAGPRARRGPHMSRDRP